MEPNLAWLEDPQVFRVNRLDAHSDHHFYESTEDMKAGKETLRQSLNGTWKFAWSEKPSDRPAEFYREEADLTSFGEIQVPGHIELQGHDQIHYINTMYPWEGHVFLRPPHIDWNHDPVGSYVKEFDLEPGLVGKRVCISFQGVEEAMYVWLNDVFIGYAEDSFTPSEFDLTEVVRKKGNRLCVEVYKRSSAAWLEDQDFFRFSGIFRDVYLYGKPVAHVEDLWAKAGLEEDYSTGNLVIEAKVSGAAAQVEWQVLDPAGKEVAQGVLEKVLENSAVDNFVADGSNANYGAGQTILWTSKKQLFSDVAKWDVGQPNLYQLILLVKDADDNVLEVVPYKIGFRRFEIKDKLMLLNGKRLIINGVNRHEWNPRRGRSITEEDMRKDIEIMKKNNINAVRTCHYPDQSLWYQLCDEAGICLMDETNLESHGSWQKMGQCEPSWNVPGSDSRWEACVVDRATSMVERDKNHPAILWWSCGNESYAGTCILAMSRYFHKKDPSRRVHYEGVFWNRQFEEISDVESRMYASPAEVRAYLENDPGKPYLLCEYMHDMGNSIGGMESYIKLLDEFPMYQGGFIWDYIDQAIYHKNQKGQEVLGYGGDFMDRPTDYAFSGNGIVFADRTEKPAMQEVRYWYSTPQERASLDQEKKAGYEKTFKRLKEEHEALQKTAGEKAAQMQVIHGDLTYGVRGEGFSVIFGYGEGGPVSLVYDGKECLYRAPKPAVWRASTENDKGNGFPVKSAVWMASDMFAACTGCTVKEYAKDKEYPFDVTDIVGRVPAAEDIDRVEINYCFTTRTVPETEIQISYQVNPAGQIHVQLHYKGKQGLPQLPEFGLRMVLPEAVEEYSWEGLCGETYPDRKKGGYFGVHQDEPKVSDYLVPQECQNHADTCVAKVGAMRIVMDQEPFHFSAIPYTPQELESALHKEELPNSVRTVVSILGKMRGVGGIDSWGTDVEETYHISAENDIDFGFYIEKIN